MAPKGTVQAMHQRRARCSERQPTTIDSPKCPAWSKNRSRVSTTAQTTARRDPETIAGPRTELVHRRELRQHRRRRRLRRHAGGGVDKAAAARPPPRSKHTKPGPLQRGRAQERLSQKCPRKESWSTHLPPSAAVLASSAAGTTASRASSVRSRALSRPLRVSAGASQHGDSDVFSSPLSPCPSQRRGKSARGQ